MHDRSAEAQLARAEKRSVARERYQVAYEKQRLERLAKEAPEINETLRAVAVEAARSIHMAKRLMAHHLAEDVNTDAAELLASAKYGAPLRPAPPAVALAHRPCHPACLGPAGAVRKAADHAPVRATFGFLGTNEIKHHAANIIGLESVRCARPAQRPLFFSPLGSSAHAVLRRPWSCLENVSSCAWPWWPGRPTR